MKKIYLMLMHTNTFPSKIVKLFTRYKYSHVALSLNKDCNVLYSFGRRNINNFLDGGYVVLNKDSEFFNKFNNTICRIYELNIKENKYLKLKDILNNMGLNSNNYNYDFIGIIPRLFGIPYVRKNKYVCSFFIADLLERCDIYKFNKKTCFIKPKDFESINNIKIIYEGLY